MLSETTKKYIADSLEDSFGVTFWMHPETFEEFKKSLPVYDKFPLEEDSSQFDVIPDTLNKIKVNFSPLIPQFKTNRVWVPPKSQFWEMEPKDEIWAAPLGFGHYVNIDERMILAIKNRMQKNLTRMLLYDSPPGW